MEESAYDLVVIGAGPAGQKGAIQAAKLGKSVLVVDRTARLGGACLNQGTIPSKTLREAILDLTGFRERSFYGRSQSATNISINDLNYRLNRVIEEQNALIGRQFAKNGIDILHGTARFTGPDRVEIVDDDGRPKQAVQAQRFHCHRLTPAQSH